MNMNKTGTKILKKIFDDSQPFRFGLIFDTKRNKYFYDRGTGKVMQCSIKEANFIQMLLNGNTYKKMMDRSKMEGKRDGRLRKNKSPFELIFNNHRKCAEFHMYYK